MDYLCRTYWRPIHDFIRFCGRSPEVAEDLTQEFLARLMRSKALVKIDRRNGALRQYLKQSVRNFLRDAWRHDGAQRRGGNYQMVSIESSEAVGVFNATDGRMTPDEAFDYGWAVALLNKAHQELRESYRGSGERFEILSLFLPGRNPDMTSAQAAEKLGVSASSVRVEVSRLRQELGLKIRGQIMATVSSPEEVEDELATLMDIFRRRVA